MHQILSNHDLKTLLQGVAGVAACGLLLGAAMHPKLDVGEKPAGPQMLMGQGAQRGGGSPDGPGLAAYAGATPDYVIGSDWTRPPPAEWAEEAPIGDASDDNVVAADDDPPATPYRAAWRDEPREPAAYPSANGGLAYEANLPAPPPPPDEADQG